MALPLKMVRALSTVEKSRRKGAATRPPPMGGRILPLAARPGKPPGPLNLVLLVMLAAGCGGSSKPAETNPCLTLCRRLNQCRAGVATPIPCEAACVYGGNLQPGLAPAPVCPDLAVQQACVQAAVAMSCDTYLNAALACANCSKVSNRARKSRSRHGVNRLLD